MGLIALNKRADYLPIHNKFERIPAGITGVIILGGLGNIKLIKSNKSFECMCCNGKKSKKTRYIGDNNDRICYDCILNGWIDKSIETFNNKIKDLINIKEETIKNKELWDKEVLINSI